MPLQRAAQIGICSQEVFSTYFCIDVIVPTLRLLLSYTCVDRSQMSKTIHVVCFLAIKSIRWVYSVDSLGGCLCVWLSNVTIQIQIMRTYRYKHASRQKANCSEQQCKARRSKDKSGRDALMRAAVTAGCTDNTWILIICLRIVRWSS